MFLFHILNMVGKAPQTVGETFAELYKEFMPKIYRYVNYRVSDTHLAEDITSAVFEKALVKFTSYSDEKGAFSTWIFSIARNTIIDHFRTNKQARTVALDNADSIADGDDSPEENAARTEEIHQLQASVARLPRPQQEIISLKFGAEMTNRQIAKMLGISESNVGTILYRAVKKLREDFQG